ncbi:hypothetical protein LJC24_02910 [Desulfococcaceae bacterium OttesenSCG-928-F15]|nr:hypothetical protein [Desulfococcaceae bacterium OttesenSCG-928-F15]
MNPLMPFPLHKTNDDTIECFSHFRMKDRICRDFCAVRLRCLVEQQHRLFPELMDEFFISDETFPGMQ